MRKEGESIKGTAGEIKKVLQYDGDGELEVVIVVDENSKPIGEYPFKEDHGLVEGVMLKITPEIETLKSGGSITTYRIEAV